MRGDKILATKTHVNPTLGKQTIKNLSVNYQKLSGAAALTYVIINALSEFLTLKVFK